MLKATFDFEHSLSPSLAPEIQRQMLQSNAKHRVSVVRYNMIPEQFEIRREIQKTCLATGRNLLQIYK